MFDSRRFTQSTAVFLCKPYNYVTLWVDLLFVKQIFLDKLQCFNNTPFPQIFQAKYGNKKKLHRN